MKGKKSVDNVLENIKYRFNDMFSAEQKVAQFILDNPTKAIQLNVSELAKSSGVSDATVVRMAKHAGYEGHYQMRLKLTYNIGSSNDVSGIANKKDQLSVDDLVKLAVFNLESMCKQVDSQMLIKAAEAIVKSDTVYMAAAGNTAPIANDFGFRMGRLGIRTSYSIVPEHFLNSISLARDNDLVFAISRSGSSKQTIQSLELAKRKNIKTIVITSSKSTPMTKYADFLFTTDTDNEWFGNIKPDSHLKEYMLFDLIFYYAKTLLNKNNFDDVEYILSGYKL